MKTTAEQLFDAKYELNNQEDVVFNKLLSAFDMKYDDVTTWKFDDWLYDPYDYSFEFTGVDVNWTPTEDQWNRAFEIGFVRGWINYTDNTEMRHHKSSQYSIKRYKKR